MRKQKCSVTHICSELSSDTNITYGKQSESQYGETAVAGNIQAHTLLTVS